MNKKADDIRSDEEILAVAKRAEANRQREAYRALTNEERGALEAAMDDIVDEIEDILVDQWVGVYGEATKKAAELVQEYGKDAVRYVARYRCPDYRRFSEGSDYVEAAVDSVDAEHVRRWWAERNA